MKNKILLILTFTAFAMAPLFMLVLAWYLGFFVEASWQTRNFATELALLRPYRGDYHNGSGVIRQVQARLEKLGIACRPILVLRDDNTKVIKAHMKGEGGCIIPRQVEPNPEEMLLLIPAGSYKIAVSRAHPVIALQKNLRLLRKQLGSDLSFPLVFMVDEQGNQVLRPLFPQTSMQ